MNCAMMINEGADV